MILVILGVVVFILVLVGIAASGDDFLPPTIWIEDKTRSDGGYNLVVDEGVMREYRKNPEATKKRLKLSIDNQEKRLT